MCVCGGGGGGVDGGGGNIFQTVFQVSSENRHYWGLLFGLILATKLYALPFTIKRHMFNNTIVLNTL